MESKVDILNIKGTGLADEVTILSAKIDNETNKQQQSETKTKTELRDDMKVLSS